MICRENKQNNGDDDAGTEEGGEEEGEGERWDGSTGAKGFSLETVKRDA
jgi:hypothetical protein